MVGTAWLMRRWVNEELDTERWEVAADQKTSKVGQTVLNWLLWRWELELARAHADELDCEGAILCLYLGLCAGACFRKLTTVLLSSAVTSELFAFYCLFP